LTGELRHVGHADRRVAEARKFGLERVVQPTQRVSTLRQALAALSRGTEGEAQAA
jgi:DNA repair protein RadA/Sms